MSTSLAVSVNNVSKRYMLYEKPQDRLKHSLFRHFGKKYGQEFWALRDVSFDLRRGETLGIIGRNGCGKSTLLQIIAGTLMATGGETRVNGRVVALLELGSGFNPEFTGRENIFLTGSALGVSREEMKRQIEEIINFADIGLFIDQPVKLYSSGMYVRLAFSVLKGLDPDIFLVDEALAVGDIRFAQKCFRYFEEKRKAGKAFLLVSHDMQAILRLCDRVMLLDEGQVIKKGNPLEVVDYYYARQVGAEFSPAEERGKKEETGEKTTSMGNHPPLWQQQDLSQFKGLRIGDRKVEVIGFSSLNGNGRETTAFFTGEPMALEIYCRANQDVEDVTVTFQVTDRFGAVVFGQNSYMATRQKLSMSRGSVIKTRVEFRCSFFEGEYLVGIGATACALEFCEEYYDYLEGCLRWTVGRPEWRTFHGLVDLPTDWRIEKTNGP
jgi:ABC-type polysaccharide/polyol phosphate transport system ATPase subunit